MFKRAMAAAGMVLGIVGCGAEGASDGTTPDQELENIGSATFELTSVPTGVGCLRLTVTGATTVTKDFGSLVANSSTAILNMDRLPLGNVTIDGAAYATTCGTGSTLYVADTATAFLQSGVVSNVALTFRKNNPVIASVSFVGNVQALSAMHNTTLAVIDGNVYYWGLGPTSFTQTTTATLVPGLSNVAALSPGSGSRTPCAIKTDESAWCWGNNGNFQAGVPSPGSITTPVRFGTDDGYTMISSGGFHTCAAQPNKGTIKCVGSGTQGQLGNSANMSSSTPIALGEGAVRSIALGQAHSCAVMRDLGVSCWGSNIQGQLGDGTSVARSNPTPVVGLTAVKSVSAGAETTCAVTSDGAAKCWGANGSGQVGDGTNTVRLTPVSVVGLSGVNMISEGANHTCALLDAGTVKCWGDNSSGQLGDGTQISRLTPVAVALPDKAVLLSCGYEHTCAVTARQDIYCWGQNEAGELGDGGFIYAVKPTKVRLP